MGNIRFVLILLAAMLAAPLSVLAAPSDGATEVDANAVKQARRALLLADARSARDLDDDEENESESDDDAVENSRRRGMRVVLV